MAPLSSVTPSVHACPGEPGSSSAAATLQFHLENWPGLGMTTSPVNKAVYINPARHRAAERALALTLGQHLQSPMPFQDLEARALTQSLFHLANSSEHCTVPQHQLAGRWSCFLRTVGVFRMGTGSGYSCRQGHELHLKLVSQTRPSAM